MAYRYINPAWYGLQVYKSSLVWQVYKSSLVLYINPAWYGYINPAWYGQVYTGI